MRLQHDVSSRPIELAGCAILEILYRAPKHPPTPQAPSSVIQWPRGFSRYDFEPYLFQAIPPQRRIFLNPYFSAPNRIST